MKFLKQIILLVALFSLIHTQETPVNGSIVDKVKEFLNEEKVLDHLGLTNCKSDVVSILAVVGNTGLGTKASLSDLAKLYGPVSNIYTNCPEFKSKVSEAVQLAYKFLTSRLSKKEDEKLSFLAFDKDDCMDLLENIKNDVEDMLKYLFRDLSIVKAALDDFFVQLKNIPTACT